MAEVNCIDCGAEVEPEFTDFVFIAFQEDYCWECALHAYRECPCDVCVKRSNLEDGCP